MTAPENSPLHTGLLAAVSRSFYLSLRVLPEKVRGPMSLSYLLARAADTIADVPVRPAAERLGLLAALGRVIGGEAGEELYGALRGFAQSVDHAGERTLLERLPECMEALHGCSAEEAVLIRTVLERIIHGQSLDLERFPVTTPPAALPDAAALEEYTWLVAGCVGEFWTEICLLHLPRSIVVPRAEILRHAVNYGKGLQLINILRDQPKDMAGGRCYLPADELRAAGTDPLVWPAPDWQPWQTVRRRWLGTARGYLESGKEYVRAVKSVRLRFAALLPLLIGGATLDLLETQPEGAPPEPVKIPRRMVKRLMVRALWTAVRGRV